MKEIAELIDHVLATEKLHGKYSGLFLLALLFLWMVPKDFSGRRGKKLALFALVQTCCILFVPLLLLIQRGLGFGENYWEYLWTVPILTVISYTAVELSAMQAEKKRFWGAVLACLAVIALSGTVLPFKGDAQKWKYTDTDVTQVIKAVGEQKELYGGEVLLLAPEEVLERARAIDGGIRLVYGRDMWDTQANRAVADEYPQDIKLLYEKMQRDYEFPDEVADLAKWYGCDVLVLREKLTGSSRQAEEWSLVEEMPGYVIYRYVGAAQTKG